MRKGARTGEFGKWLLQYVEGEARFRDCTVYYDHGDQAHDPHVCAIQGFCGDALVSSNRLADVDVVLATQSGEILCLIEIEETSATPKTLIGDVFAILMCSRFAVREGGRRRYLEITPDTRLIVAGVGDAGGQQTEKVNEIIKPRLAQFEGPGDGIALGNVELLVEESLSVVLERLRERLKQMLALRCR